MLSTSGEKFKQAEGELGARPLQPFSLLLLPFACPCLICVILHPFWPCVPESAGFFPKS